MATPIHPSNGYIHSFLYDSFVFLFSPLICLIIMMGLHQTPWMDGAITISNFFFLRPVYLLLMLFTQGHIAAMVVRSHLNREVFQRNRLKILLTPVLLLIAMNLSIHFLIASGILWTGWTFYHYSRQHFGIARLYDSRRGIYSPGERAMDMLACMGISILPIMTGSLAFYGVFKQYDELHAAGLHWLVPISMWITQFFEKTKIAQLLCLGAICVSYVLFNAWVYYSKKRISWQKLLFVSQLLIMFIAGWLFLHREIGYFSILALHSVQYYGLLSITERKSVAQRWRNLSPTKIIVVTAGLVLGIGLLAGIYSVKYTNTEYLVHPSTSLNNFLFSIVITMNLSHFWFDSFIWPSPAREVLAHTSK